MAINNQECNNWLHRFKVPCAVAVSFLVIGLSAGMASVLLRTDTGSSPDSKTSNLTTVSHIQPALSTRRISDINVGERVWVGHNPSDEVPDLRFGEVDEATWRLMEIRAPRPDGGVSYINMIRPISWLEERGVTAGGYVDLEVLECGIFGPANVISVSVCPEIHPGPGRIVTATFRHPASDVVDLGVEGLEEPIGVTSNHLFWSADRRDFVPAGSLDIGEQLLTIGGMLRVASRMERGPPEDVYNLEVEVDHLYRLGEAGVLVHNACGTNWHHSIPKFLGGFDKGQDLIELTKAQHDMFHRMLGQRLSDWSETTYGVRMSGLGGSPGKSSRSAWQDFFKKNRGSQFEAFNILFETSKQFDEHNNTEIVESLFENFRREASL